MNLLMISGDRSAAAGKHGAFWYTLEELAKHWDRIDVICPFAGHGAIAQEQLNVFFHPCPHGLWYQSRWIATMGKELLKQHQHNVMTVQEYPPFYNGSGARKLTAVTGVPHVLEVHHVVGHPKPASLAEQIGFLWSRSYLPKASQSAAAVRVVNSSMRSLLASYGVANEKIQVVPSFYLNGDVLHPDPSVPKEYDLAFCARLVQNKGLGPVLEAVAELPGVRLLVTGEGPFGVQYERMAGDLEILDRVHFAGWLPEQADVARAMQSSRIFVMNSTSEGGPRSALEAMACGIPVVATKVGIMPEVIRDGVNGVFTNGTKDDLKEKIGNLLSNSSVCQKMGQEAAKIVEKFDRKKLVAGYADFLKMAAGSL